MLLTGYVVVPELPADVSTVGVSFGFGAEVEDVPVGQGPLTPADSGPIDWPGFESAYGIEYDAAGAQAGDPLHNLVVVASTKEGGLVNVSVAAPPTLFDSLQLKAAVASLQPARVRS